VRRAQVRRAVIRAAVVLGFLLGCGVVLDACVFAAPRYHGPLSDHFDGEHFHNQLPAAPGTNVIKWWLNRDRGPWEDAPDAPFGPKPVERVGQGQLRVTWVNHATALIQMDGVNILTDPIWSERCSPVSFAGPARVRPPGIRFEDLPPIDLVLLSHDHYDHFDLPTLRRLDAAFHPRFLTGLGNQALLERAGVSHAIDRDWWQAVPISDAVRVTLVPAQHFSNRSLTDRNVTLWTGFVIEGPAGAVYFAGDTGFGPHYEQIYRRFGAVRLALLPIGAYRPEWFMGPIHMSPSDAVQAHLALHARTSVAIHYGTFRLADDGQREPVEKLRASLAEHAVPDAAFWTLGFGEGRDVP
jgi:L-ascorbate metabolism protein UlaG (beta-lactamase superfamily)